MPEVPKIVYDRLRAGLPAGPVPETAHPDPDVLTAFAEHSLSETERESVVQHLAWCGDCRELVALSIPPTETAAQPSAAEESESTAPVATGTASRQWSWFTWPGLRWAALAAGLLVAGGLLLIRPGKPNAVPDARQQSASAVTQPADTIVADKAVPAPHGLRKEINPEEKSAPAVRAFSRDKESKLAHSAAPPDKAIARGQFGHVETRTTTKDLATGAAVGGVVGAAPTSPAPAPQVPHASEMVEVTSESAAVMPEDARIDQTVNDLPVSGRNMSDLTISKAKAAKTESNDSSTLQQEYSRNKRQSTASTADQQQGAVTSTNRLASNLQAAKPASSPLPPPQWAIHGNDLQRSLDSGVAWKTVLHSDRPLLSYATSGNDIWAGGKAGDLFYSANAGVTWSQMHPAAQQQVLADDVTHIDIDGPSNVTLFTSNDQSWHTADGGKTWEKR
jgi:putative zinc finger protein